MFLMPSFDMSKAVLKQLFMLFGRSMEQFKAKVTDPVKAEKMQEAINSMTQVIQEAAANGGTGSVLDGASGQNEPATKVRVVQK